MEGLWKKLISQCREAWFIGLQGATQAAMLQHLQAKVAGMLSGPNMNHKGLIMAHTPSSPQNLQCKPLTMQMNHVGLGEIARGL